MFLFITAFMLSVSTIVSAFEDIDEMVEEGYLTPEQNSVLISVNNKNEKRGKELKDKISKIDVDGIIDSSYVIKYIGKRKTSIFKEVAISAISSGKSS